ncbi:hypothetical protein CEXT_211161 [Caerostris extrusa]|uniref:Uncharacterized protein n=1 Tax=Caerostris extrusa TaxID=172846 RepID=A0AAV4XXE0_CAEEX|nr:hypothetical protein CEXT_211161 [Caerostris extrusa]
MTPRRREDPSLGTNEKRDRNHSFEHPFYAPFDDPEASGKMHRPEQTREASTHVTVALLGIGPMNSSSFAIFMDPMILFLGGERCSEAYLSETGRLMFVLRCLLMRCLWADGFRRFI